MAGAGVGFVPEDVVAVVEPRRPTDDDPRSTLAWLAAVRRVAEHGCAPSCAPVGRASDVPLVSDVEDFLRVAVEAGRSFTVFGLRRVVRSEVGGLVQHGLLNMLVAVARAVAGADVQAALQSTDAAELAAEMKLFSDRNVDEVRCRTLRRRSGAGGPRRAGRPGVAGLMTATGR